MRKEDSSRGSYWLELAILTFLTFVALAGNAALEVYRLVRRVAFHNELVR